MSSERATFLNAMVAVTRLTSSGSRRPSVIGVTVHPGATALTLARGATAVISFFSDKSSPPEMADFAAA